MSFKSWHSYMQFSHAVKNKSRYVLDRESQDFLKEMENTCASRVEIITPNSLMWRAQLGHDERLYYQDEIYIDDFPIPYSTNRMRLLSNGASEGRANPKGIPCLYVASTKETAMSEIRPWLGSIISVAKFSNTQELRVIDFSKYHGERFPFYIEEPDDDKKQQAVWWHIDNAFSEPVTNSDSKSDYTPTQIIAELIKSLGYDGIAFKSSLGNGHNLALFDLDSAHFQSCSLSKADKVEFSFSGVSTPFSDE
ncbi:RES family NAD+ phosphorylase [Shewanella baltica]|uniref:RES family NAD+ phosphorylase n=1 Tax=Shewanella baltica TaxID=62322 RepID=UPI00217E3B95|nr:RES family NAD+ phosphorylase [Shewanella baltica]MCS6095446.1 RES family NAD+ phosphorylase [Shewanella baltica]MCS6100841.1 RES family NAD+ phosphorylase [Shewanella baltica]MCS6183475.1 RES family NAD+ phosphorylase [Shewanella baltica]MCS6226554.1 RES family NAD+ phosphorylase [Shewanella baltica]